LVPVDGGDRKKGDTGKERRVANVGDGVNQGLVVPRVLQRSNLLGGDVEDPGESHVSIRIAARNFDLTEEAVGDLAGYRFVVVREGNAGSDARMNGFGSDEREKGMKVLTFRYASRRSSPQRSQTRSKVRARSPE